jgi:hypothetical protein
MDTWLIAITAISLTAAVASSTVAWRLLRQDRARTAARTAALAAAAGVERARGGAHATAAAALHEFLPAGGAAAPTVLDAAESGDSLVVDAGAIFARPAVDSGSSGRQHRLMAAAAVFGAVVIAGGTALFVSGRTPGTGPAVVRTPLELVALSHQRTEGVLAVSGLVRNPAQGAGVARVDAEVRVFDASGILIATRSATLNQAALAPGQESPFVITVGEAPTAARYRVSFTTDGSMLPHVDRRTNLPAAVTADAR